MQNVSRADIEDFLFTEADLLDEWRLPEWLELFTDDAIYYVPSTDVAADASPDRLIPMPGDFWRHGLCNDIGKCASRVPACS